MRPSFYPRLINNPFDDPGLFIPFLFEKRALLFDLGDISALSARDILKTEFVFVSHTHMDHFIGFEHLLRLYLGREKILRLFGPRGFLANVTGKLAGYAWNLVANYRNRLILRVTEVRPNLLLTQDFDCQSGFRNSAAPVESPFNGSLLEEPTFSVSAIHLDHGMPCLGFSIRERFHINIKKSALSELGLEVGPWLRDSKQKLFDGQDPESEFRVPGLPDMPFNFGNLARRIARISPGQKVTYIADSAGTADNLEKIAALAQGSDQLFIEAAFLDRDSSQARAKHHLTARQAGMVAGLAGVKQFTPFHFSPRYSDQGHLLQQEAHEAYRMALKGKG